jgi:hypothetical protein
LRLSLDQSNLGKNIWKNLCLIIHPDKWIKKVPIECEMEFKVLQIKILEKDKYEGEFGI